MPPIKENKRADKNIQALKLPTRKEQKIALENKEIFERIAGKLKKSSKEVEIGVRDEKDHVKIPVSAFHFLSTILEYMAAVKLCPLFRPSRK